MKAGWRPDTSIRYLSWHRQWHKRCLETFIRSAGSHFSKPWKTYQWPILQWRRSKYWPPEHYTDCVSRQPSGSIGDSSQTEERRIVDAGMHGYEGHNEGSAVGSENLSFWSRLGDWLGTSKVSITKTYLATVKRVICERDYLFSPIPSGKRLYFKGVGLHRTMNSWPHANTRH